MGSNFQVPINQSFGFLSYEAPELFHAKFQPLSLNNINKKGIFVSPPLLNWTITLFFTFPLSAQAVEYFLLRFPPLVSPKNPVPGWGLSVIWAEPGTGGWQAVQNEEWHSESLIRKAPSLAFIIINKPWSFAQQPVGRNGSLNLEFEMAKNQREPTKAAACECWELVLLGGEIGLFLAFFLNLSSWETFSLV